MDRYAPGSRWLAVLLPVCILLCICCAPLARAADPAGADLQFFEKRVRPILVEHCYECHRGDKPKGNLRLDSAEGWLTGGDSGPAIEAGKPDESLLIQAVRHDGDAAEMPPDAKLPADKIAVLEQWVARGAIAPRIEKIAGGASAPTRRPIDLAEGRKFWAYQPPKLHPIPPAASDLESYHPIDRFVAARLREAGLRIQPEADRAVLVRRLYFDLWGLPPDAQALRECQQDPAADWYERLVDRLLASPRFGERWGRHWLDVVRFGESLTLRGFILKDAWRYRDYVIESFNADRPFDRFVQEQIAGDLMGGKDVDERRRRLVATSFLALGNTNLEEQDKSQLEMDVVDEQLDVIGKAILAQTIGCARCHDHKFDPIPTRDYYALAGILRNTKLLEHANVSAWVTAPLPLSDEDEARFAAAEEQVRLLEAQVKRSRDRVTKLAAVDGKSLDKVVAVADLPGVVVDDTQAKVVGEWTRSTSSKPYIGAGYLHDQDDKKGAKTVTFTPELAKTGRYEIRLAYSPGGNRSAKVPVTVFSGDGEKTIHVNMQEAPTVEGRFVSLGEYRCEAAGQNFVLVANEGTRGHVIVDAVQFLPLDGAVAASDKTTSAARGASLAEAELEAKRELLGRLEKELSKARKAAPQRPTSMTVLERKSINDAPIHLRGSVHALGEVVPRGFLQVVAVTAAPLPSDQSGRLQLAEWLVSAENPLPARVYANRVWHWLFGRGLVASVDNFGTTGETPTHAELLDHLAIEFRRRDWSVKQLVRYVVTSEAYRQGSRESAAGLAADPENRLLWRNRRKRLEAECLRDAMLSISGQLSDEAGGATIPPGVASDFDYVDRGARRSVYVPVLRNAIPEIFEAFDFPDPSLVAGSRNASTVAPQALFLMNHTFVRAQAEAAARRLLSDEAASAV
ncbi:MAG TPA: DUF1553 domain-containing protein, partial [Pirellulales bacterium]